MEWGHKFWKQLRPHHLVIGLLGILVIGAELEGIISLTTATILTTGLVVVLAMFEKRQKGKETRNRGSSE